MNHGVLLALRRKRDSFDKAGLADKVALIDERIALLEIELGVDEALEPESAPEAEPEAEPEHEPEAPAGVVLTPAAQARADELGVSDDDFMGQEPSGKGGEFLVSDVVRIAEAKNANTDEEDDDGDD